MRVQRTSDNLVEVQGVRDLDTVVVHLGDGKRLVVECAGSAGEQPLLSVDFGHTPVPWIVYTEDGEDLTTLDPPAERTDN